MNTKTITLKSGGTIKISGDFKLFKLFELDGYDRQFMEGLSDYLRIYGQPLPEIGDV